LNLEQYFGFFVFWEFKKNNIFVKSRVIKLFCKTFKGNRVKLWCVV